MMKVFVVIYGLVCMAAGAGSAAYTVTHRPAHLVAGWALIECKEMLGAGYIYSNGKVIAMDSEELEKKFPSFKDWAADFGKIPESGQHIMQSCPDGTGTL